jgi:hypothetical protein
MKGFKNVSVILKSFSAFIMLCLLNAVAFAQDKKVDVSIGTNSSGSGNWYASPWVWIVGAAVFILLLVALMRGNSNRD